MDTEAPITRIEVRSSAVCEIGHNGPERVLEVRYHGKDDEPGALWRAHPVESFEYGAMLLTGASIGTILARIKKDAAVTWWRVVKDE